MAREEGSHNANDIRSFTAIVCSECQYLEYPGCDVHGLYTEMLPNGQAKCPNCAVSFIRGAYWTRSKKYPNRQQQTTYDLFEMAVGVVKQEPTSTNGAVV